MKATPYGPREERASVAPTERCVNVHEVPLDPGCVGKRCVIPFISVVWTDYPWAPSVTTGSWSPSMTAP
jgi:hypothetical protein